MHHYCASRLAGLARVPGMSESLGADAVTCIVKYGAVETMNRFNGPRV